MTAVLVIVAVCAVLLLTLLAGQARLDRILSAALDPEEHP